MYHFVYCSDDNKVFQWQMNSAELIRTRSITCTSLLSLSENAALKTQTPLWGAYRNYMGAERHFYLGNKEFFMKSDQVIKSGSRIFIGNSKSLMGWVGLLGVDLIKLTILTMYLDSQT